MSSFMLTTYPLLNTMCNARSESTIRELLMLMLVPCLSLSWVSSAFNDLHAACDFVSLHPYNASQMLSYVSGSSLVCKTCEIWKG